MSYRSLSVLITSAVLWAILAGSCSSPSAPAGAGAQSAPDAGQPPAPGTTLATDVCFKPDASVTLTGASCAPLTPPQISCYLPSDIQGSTRQPVNSQTQRAGDIFSWQEFIALNWPASATERGKPDMNKPLSASGPRVWETWKETYEVYLPDGGAPAAWNTSQSLPTGCGPRATKLLTRDEKVDDVLDSALQAAASTGRFPATLTDQDLALVRYEIRMNKPMFDYIVSNGFYNGTRQVAATQVAFPEGGILVKAAWREVPTNQYPPLYHTTEACICKGNVAGQPTECAPRTMGLVGLHITQKTPSAPSWVWSTFEQRANVEAYSGQSASFNDVNCKDCPKNQQTAPGRPNQVTRTTPISSSQPVCTTDAGAPYADDVVTLNNDMRTALAAAGSIFQRYQLVVTQVPVPSAYPGTQPTTVFGVSQPVSANTTMETFVQPTSTCIGCHSTARSLNPTAFISSDFSFTLNNAWPKPTNSPVLPPPTDAGTQWDPHTWDLILNGQDVAANTYEKLPKFTGAKLHCSSCHLDEGRDPDAAWWVGMYAKYKTTPALQARINQCFERSENGKALCTPASDAGVGNCGESRAMKSLLAYMTWLDAEWAALKLPGPPANGYPPIPTLTGDATRGASVFQQKCAVCHGREGQGRYQDDTYFRPALWGPHSFNAQAGMDKPSNAAAFIHANMPLGSGGLLTPQEAWDVAAYIDSKPRPGSGANDAGVAEATP